MTGIKELNKDKNITKKTTKFNFVKDYFLHGFYEESNYGYDGEEIHTKGYYFIKNKLTNKIDLVRIHQNVETGFLDFTQILLSGTDNDVCNLDYYITKENSEFYDYFKLFQTIYDAKSLIKVDDIFEDINNLYNNNVEYAKKHIQPCYLRYTDGVYYNSYDLQKYISKHTPKEYKLAAEKMFKKLLRVINEKKFKELYELNLDKKTQVIKFEEDYLNKIDKIEKDIKKINKLIDAEEVSENFASLYKKLAKKKNALNELKENKNSEIEKFEDSIELPKLTVAKKYEEDLKALNY